MGQQLAEAALQLKQHEPEAEDRPVSFLGGVGLEPAPPPHPAAARLQNLPYTENLSAGS